MSTATLAGDESAYDYLLCVYCDNQWAIGTVVCPVCKEYKGIMTQEQWDEYLGDLYNTPVAEEPPMNGGLF